MRGSALEEFARATGLQFVEKRIERLTNPELFLDILFVGAVSIGSADKEVAALLIARGQYGLNALGHWLLELLALLMIGAGADARLKSFRFSADGALQRSPAGAGRARSFASTPAAPTGLCVSHPEWPVHSWDL